MTNGIRALCTGCLAGSDDWKGRKDDRGVEAKDLDIAGRIAAPLMTLLPFIAEVIMLLVAILRVTIDDMAS